MGQSLFLEGIDGSGKSTLIKLLNKILTDNGEEVLLLREPGGSAYYEAIREHIHYSALERTPLSDALTCAGGIAQNVAETKHALREGKWVISDRSYISNIAYQHTRGLDLALADSITKIALDDFSYDIKILIDIPVEVSKQRLIALGKNKDRWENQGEEHFKQLRSNYLELANSEGLTILDGTKPIEILTDEILTLMGINT